MVLASCISKIVLKKAELCATIFSVPPKSMPIPIALPPKTPSPKVESTIEFWTPSGSPNKDPQFAPTGTDPGEHPMLTPAAPLPEQVRDSVLLKLELLIARPPTMLTLQKVSSSVLELLAKSTKPFLPLKFAKLSTIKDSLLDSSLIPFLKLPLPTDS